MLTASKGSSLARERRADVFSSKSDEWSTPQTLFDTLNEEFHFTLDPCAKAENAKCKMYYTISENGLEKTWAGHCVFCNPPYSQIQKWVKKCAEEARKGATVVMLIPARTDTRWFHDYIYKKADIRFIKVMSVIIIVCTKI